jgi:RNA polymerase sigma-70 factor (ECF subfamily)
VHIDPDDRPAEADADRRHVEAAAGGDREAFAVLVSRYQVRLVNLARALTGDDGEAEDLAQEAFIRAWKSIGGFRGDATFRTWLYRIATNVIQSHLRRRSRRRRWWGPSLDERPDDRRGEHSAMDPSVPSTIEDDVARRQEIDRALATLPPELRIAVTLRDVHGFDYREIAEMLGVPIGTVESRIFRARKRLRPLLVGVRS